jgi:hypothetical protein
MTQDPLAHDKPQPDVAQIPRPTNRAGTARLDGQFKAPFDDRMHFHIDDHDGSP